MSTHVDTTNHSGPDVAEGANMPTIVDTPNHSGPDVPQGGNMPTTVDDPNHTGPDVAEVANKATTVDTHNHTGADVAEVVNKATTVDTHNHTGADVAEVANKATTVDTHNHTGADVAEVANKATTVDTHNHTGADVAEGGNMPTNVDTPNNTGADVPQGANMPTTVDIPNHTGPDVPQGANMPTTVDIPNHTGPDVPQGANMPTTVDIPNHTGPDVPQGVNMPTTVDTPNHTGPDVPEGVNIPTTLDTPNHTGPDVAEDKNTSSETGTPDVSKDTNTSTGMVTPIHTGPAVPEGKDVNLRTMLKGGTQERHDQAEATNFIKQVINCNITVDIYKLFLADLYHIYSAMEEVMEKNKGHPFAGPIYFPSELNRKKTLEEDLNYFLGTTWTAKDLPCTDATRKYVKRIYEIGENEPELLVPHSYTRYLGDLSGGQILKRKIAKSLDLPPTGEGTHFYEFEQIDDIKKFKDFYTGRMNSLEVGSGMLKAIQEEAKEAFLFNIKMFEELDEIALRMPVGYKSNAGSARGKKLDSNGGGEGGTLMIQNKASLIMYVSIGLVAMYVACMLGLPLAQTSTY